jgi:hypothetical protein
MAYMRMAGYVDWLDGLGKTRLFLPANLSPRSFPQHHEQKVARDVRHNMSIDLHRFASCTPTHWLGTAAWLGGARARTTAEYYNHSVGLAVAGWSWRN